MSEYSILKMGYLDINWEEELICSYSGINSEKAVVSLYRQLDEIPLFSKLMEECYSYNEQKILDIVICCGVNNEYDIENCTEEIIDKLQELGFFTNLEEYVFEVLQKYSLLAIIDDDKCIFEVAQTESSRIMVGEAQNCLLPQFSINGIVCIQGYTIYSEKKILTLEEANK